MLVFFSCFPMNTESSSDSEDELELEASDRDEEEDDEHDLVFFRFFSADLLCLLTDFDSFSDFF